VLLLLVIFAGLCEVIRAAQTAGRLPGLFHLDDHRHLAGGLPCSKHWV
jgi:hypothetical protein